MITDVAPRWCLLGCFGGAMAAGCEPAFVDLGDVERADAGELVRMAERVGVDMARFSLGCAPRSAVARQCPA